MSEEIENKLNEYVNEIGLKIRLKIEGIKFELTKESLESLIEVIIYIYTEEFNKFDELNLISFKEVKEFIEGKRDEPWESSNEDFGAYWTMTLRPALMKEIKYGFDALIDFKYVKEQVYNNIFENMKLKRKK